MIEVLEHLPPTHRTLLLGGTAAILALATGFLGQSGLPEWLQHVVALGVVGGLAFGWREVRARTPVTTAAASPPRDRGMMVGAPSADRSDRPWNDQLAALDPAFSLPVLHAALRTLADLPAGGPPQVQSLEVLPGEIGLSAVVPGTPDSVRLRVTRPLGVPLSAPGHAAHGWRLASREVVPGVVRPARPTADPGMPAARRALLLRDPSFELDDFASYLRHLRSDLAAGEPGEHLDPQGAADLAFYGAPGAASPTEPVRWLEVELDGWFERIEVEHAGWWMSLVRPVGDRGAPWRVWRLVPTEPEPGRRP